MLKKKPSKFKKSVVFLLYRSPKFLPLFTWSESIERLKTTAVGHTTLLT